MGLFRYILNFILEFFSEKREEEITNEDGQNQESVNVPVEVVLPDLPVEEDEELPSKPKYTPKYLWVLDPGHGMLQPGKRSPFLPDGRQLLEYEFNGDVVKRITEGLDNLGLKYFITVTQEQQKYVGAFLEQRVIRANFAKSDLPKIFVSVHANAGPTRNPAKDWSTSFGGIETWFYHNSEKGRKIATIFQNKLIKKTGLQNRGIKSRAKNQFYVLENTKMPAILTENGFFNNPIEVELLLSGVYRQKIADAHIEAILKIEKEGI